MTVSLTLLFALGLAAVLVAVLFAYAERLRRLAATLRTRADEAAGRHARVVSAVADGVYVVDEGLRITNVNAEAARFLPPQTLVGRTLDTIIAPLGSELVPDMRYAVRTGERVTRTVGNGTAFVEVLIRAAGREAVVTLRDVTESQRTGAYARETEQRLRLVAENVDAVLWTTDRNARFTSLAGGTLDELGLDALQLVGKPSGALIAEHVLRDVIDGTSVRAETARGERWLRHHVEPLLDADGSVDRRRRRLARHHRAQAHAAAAVRQPRTATG